MSQQQITVMWVPGAEDGGAMTRVISVPMFNIDSFGRSSGNSPYITYQIPVPDTANVTWLSTVSASPGSPRAPNVQQKTARTPTVFRFSKANAVVVAMLQQTTTSTITRPEPSLFYGPSISLTGATKIFDGDGISGGLKTVIPTITDVQLPNKYLLLAALGSNGSAVMGACAVIEDDNPIRA